MNVFTAIFGTIFSGVTNYFTTKQEIKAKKQERDDIVEDAKVQAKLALLSNEQTHDIDLDLISVQERGWKDDIITYVLLSPVVILMFNPVCAIWFDYDPALINQAMQEGFNALEAMPPFMYAGIGIVFADVFGLRSLVKDFAKSKFGNKLL
jgi:hypothetical protein